MRSNNFNLYLLLALLALFIVAPIARNKLQEMSIAQDIDSIQIEYSMYGRKAFRAKLDDVLERARLNPKEAKIEIKEDRRQSKASVEVRYLSRMKILFFPVERPVVIRRQIQLFELD